MFLNGNLGRLAVILFAAICLRIPFLSRGFDFFNSDHAVVGLMAKHILAGKWMVYYYGQGYMGALEAYVAALFFALGGISVLTLQLAPLSFFLAFLAVNYFLIKKVFDSNVSFITNLLLAVSAPSLSVLSLTALGGYPETLFFASACLLSLICYRQSNHSKDLLLAGLMAGIGLWVNTLFAVFLLAILIFLWAERGFFGFRSLFNFITGNQAGLPLWVKAVIWIIHIGIFIFLAGNLIAFFTGERSLDLGGYIFKLPDPPFLVKKFKKPIGAFVIEVLLIWFFTRNLVKIKSQIKAAIFFMGGFLLGFSPSLGFTLMGGNGHRLVYASGTVHAHELGGQWKAVMGHSFLESILGMDPTNIPLFTVQAIFFVLLAVVFMRTRNKNSYANFPLIVLVLSLGICLFSNLKSDRYLLPCYFAVAIIFAFSLNEIIRRWRLLGFFGILLILGLNVYAHMRLNAYFPDQNALRQGYQNLILNLEKEGIKGGYADYWTAYTFNFLSKEKIILAPYQSLDRYPEYSRFVLGLSPKVYVFRDKDPQLGGIEQNLQATGQAYLKKRVDMFWLFITQ